MKMAEKRMFAKAIVMSDAFLEMPMSTRCLYFSLSMLADDDGFVGNPKAIMRMCGATNDDMNILIAKRYILIFESGIVVIKHWRINNLIRGDRYSETTYLEEKMTLSVDAKGGYIEAGSDENGTVLGIPIMGKPSIGKDRLGKDRLGKDSSSCSELCESSEPQELPVTEIILNDGSLFPVYKNDADKWQELYPALDVMQQLRNIKGWCEDNPKNRKTRSGVRRFITGWLIREQNRTAKAPGASPSAAKWQYGGARREVTLTEFE